MITTITFKKIIFFLCFLIIIHIFYGCQKTEERIYEKELSKIDTPQKNIFSYLLKLLELNPSDLKNSYYYEADYKIICRMPLIDKVSISPFSLYNWADKTSRRFKQNGSLSSSYNALQVILDEINGDVTRQPVKTASKTPFKNAYREMCDEHKSKVDLNALKKIEDVGFSKEFDEQLGQLILNISSASLLAKKAFYELTEQEIKFLSKNPEKYFFTKGVHFNFLTAPVYTQEKISFITRRIDFTSLYEAAKLLSISAKQFRDFLNNRKNLTNSFYFINDQKPTEGILLRIGSPIGDIAILGNSDDIITGNASIIIDLGGNDTYLGSIANGTLMPGRTSIVIDVNGNDIYNNEMNPYSQGFGCLSVGMLLDMRGNDKYISGNMGQGAGIYGIGILEDSEGDDDYLMGLMGQGFGVFGTGILLDNSGNDKYLINGLGQGAGSTMGFGCLLDRNGKDKYLADRNKTRGKLIPDNEMNHVQGAGLSIRSPDWKKHFSFYGGVGFLGDWNGDDFYYSNGGNCMGSSYFKSMGVLVDDEGDDYYMAEKGHAIGCSVHLTSAIFIDRKGDDQYLGGLHTGGVGSDRSIGVMIDGEGNDIYGPEYNLLKKKIQKEVNNKNEKIKVSELEKRINSEMPDASYGAALKPKALGILIDYKGNDQYFSKSSGYGKSFGGVIPPVDPGNWSQAIFMDLGGKDYYHKKAMKNNHYLKYFGNGLCYDANYKGNDVLTKEHIEPISNSLTRNINADLKLEGEIADMLSSDFFVRYSIIDKIGGRETEKIFDIINLLKTSEDDNLNRELVEILNIFIVKERFEKAHRESFEDLLNAKASFVRGFAARTLGAYKDKRAAPALIQSINEENKKVRSQIIWALGQLGDTDSCNHIARLALKDPAINCRREAVKALNKISKKNRYNDIKNEKKIIDVLMECATDHDNCIRAYAASGLNNYVKNNRVKNKLRKLLKDNNFYVRRYAAKALIENGYKEGFPVLIETIRYPSIDTFEFYGHDLIREIAFYCGVDFSKEKRYLYTTWSKWWKRNGKDVDLEKNIKIMRDIKNAFFVKHESRGVSKFKELLKENPGNIIIKNSFVRFCSEWIKYKLLTREKITKSRLKRCVNLQKNIIEIEPDVPGHWVKLAGFYEQLSNYHKASEAMKTAVDIEPNNEKYLKVYNEYKKRTED